MLCDTVWTLNSSYCSVAPHQKPQRPHPASRRFLVSPSPTWKAFCPRRFSPHRGGARVVSCAAPWGHLWFLLLGSMNKNGCDLPFGRFLPFNLIKEPLIQSARPVKHSWKLQDGICTSFPLVTPRWSSEHGFTELSKLFPKASFSLLWVWCLNAFEQFLRLICK